MLFQEVKSFVGLVTSMYRFPYLFPNKIAFYKCVIVELIRLSSHVLNVHFTFYISIVFNLV